MVLMKQLKIFSRVDALIRRKATGTTAQLANRLDISTRTAFRIIKELREEFDADIQFCKQYQSYIYASEFSFQEKILEKY